MTKLDIYDALVACLIYSADWRTEHPAEANAYVYGLIDASTEIENRLRKEEDSAAETVDEYNDEFDAVIHCESKEDQDKLFERLQASGKIDFDLNLDEMDRQAMSIVRVYAEEHLEVPIEGRPMVYIVWKAKVLQNWKYLLSTNLLDGMYYELTYNGNKKEWYLDAYKKWENKVIKMEE